MNEAVDYVNAVVEGKKANGNTNQGDKWLSLPALLASMQHIPSVPNGGRQTELPAAQACIATKSSGQDTCCAVADGVTPGELVPLELGNQRTTALLNCLLQLKRVRLAVRDDQQYYVLLPAS